MKSQQKNKDIYLKIRIFLTAVALLNFIFIAYIVVNNDVLAFDTLIRETLYGFRVPFLTKTLTFITYIGNWQTVTVLCLLALIYKRTRVSLGIPLTAAAIFSTVLYKVTKTLFARPRPDISLHLITEGGYSFPSGHSMTGLVFYGFILWFCLCEYKKTATPLESNSIKFLKNKTVIYTITILLCILIFLIGLSRIYLGVHYPTDVLAGWSLGFVFLSVYTAIISYLERKHKRM